MPARRTTTKGYDTARKLRKEPTPAEAKLWAYLRTDQLGVSFRRQHAIGKYIPDFVCIKKKLIIELDGGQHVEQADYDAERTRFLESQGYKVLRFWNNDVINNINDVIRSIQFAMEDEGKIGKDKMADQKTNSNEKPVRVQFKKNATAEDILAGIHKIQDEWAKRHPELAHRLYPKVYDENGKLIPKE